MDKPSLVVLECTMAYLMHPQTDCEGFLIHDNLSSHLDFIVKQNPIRNNYFVCIGVNSKHCSFADSL